MGMVSDAQAENDAKVIFLFDRSEERSTARDISPMAIPLLSRQITEPAWRIGKASILTFNERDDLADWPADLPQGRGSIRDGRAGSGSNLGQTLLGLGSR